MPSPEPNSPGRHSRSAARGNCPIRRGKRILSDPRLASDGSRPRACRPTRCARSSPPPAANATACCCAPCGRPAPASRRCWRCAPWTSSATAWCSRIGKNPNLPIKRVFLPGAELGLTGELLLWAKEQGVADHEPLFFSRKRDADGSRRAVQRGQAWLIVKEASERANVRVLALRTSKHGPVGEAAPVHPHLFRHARVRQIVRSTRNLPLAQRQAGWSRLQMAYLTVGDEEARQLMRELTE